MRNGEQNSMEDFESKYGQGSMAIEELMKLEDKQQDVTRRKEMDRIIKTEQKAELDRNIQVFLHLNKEEKSLRKDLDVYLMV